MIFTYWTSSGVIAGAGGSVVPKLESAEAWQKVHPDFTVFTDADVLPLLSGIDPELPELFRRIRIPSCRSDIARLVLLYHVGGLYADAHVGPGDGYALARVLDALSAAEVVLFDNAFETENPDDLRLMNGVMGARKHSHAIKLLLTSAINNLKRHYRQERSSDGHVPYNIFVLTGAWDMSVCFFDRAFQPPRLRETFKDSVSVIKVPAAQKTYFYQLYHTYTYRAPGNHWSERQQVERLFDTAAVLAPDLMSEAVAP